MLELTHLRALAAIQNQGSLTNAAQQLNLTQSALSHLIKGLEQKLEMPLLDRKHRPVRLNQAGRYLATEASQILEQVNEVESALENMKQDQRARLLISLECHTCIEWLAPVLNAYRHAHEQVDLDLRLGEHFDPLPQLHSKALDLIITGERSSAPGIQGDPLFAYDIVAIVADHHPLANKDYLAAEDFKDQTIITYPVSECRLDLYTRFLEPAGIVPAQRRTAELTTLIIQWVASGLGIAALPRWALHQQSQQLSIIPLGPEGLWADLYALQRSNENEQAHIDAFIQLAKKMCFETLHSVRPVM